MGPRLQLDFSLPLVHEILRYPRHLLVLVLSEPVHRLPCGQRESELGDGNVVALSVKVLEATLARSCPPPLLLRALACPRRRLSDA